MATNAQQLYQDLQQYGLPPAAAAGVVGNAMVESNVDPTAKNPNGGAYGIFQWLGDRARALQQYGALHNEDPARYGTQLHFAVQEMKDTGVWDKLRTQTDPAAAADYFMTAYERPSPAEQAASKATREADARAVLAGNGAVSSATTATDQNLGQRAVDSVTDAVNTALGGVASAFLSGVKPLALQLSAVALAGGLVLAAAWKLTAGPRAQAQQAAEKALPVAAMAL